jgi:hypothetical protein
MTMEIRNATMINVFCGSCGFHITDPRSCSMIDGVIAVICPNCDAHVTLDCRERIARQRREEG